MNIFSLVYRPHTAVFGSEAVPRGVWGEEVLVWSRDDETGKVLELCG